MVGAGFHVFAVWTYIIANMDSDGFITVNPTLLAITLGGEKRLVEEAIAFSSC